jgi:deazaflavin-dependent oxidoreductase (nitroreductase family)
MVAARGYLELMPRKYKLSAGRKAFNVVMEALLGRGVNVGTTYVLATTGRKSGQPRSTPVTIWVEGSKRWLVSPYGEVGWVRNVRASGRAGLRRGQRTESVRLTELSPAEAGPVLKAYRDRYAIVGPFFEARKGDPVERFVAEASRHPVFAIEPV